ncbi:threonine/homoserine/homoserine lactone efflux protein [Litoreibacter halocynthiae]|uniref:Threonine/homoserine/homoserine lactone efflux protein n=1 Tax=Litoreibacter halocynthiae TaxID=1242689 RepID=A0A4R7LHM0_9RHOB|nr:LysE family transporter [Litoreibacter halocynthiae]TDT74026.1 threonine/homoserine/homoserine lactone efflux protein [Litoreibacter halocynthiae]
MSNDLITIATVAVLYAAVVVSPGPNFALISRLAISGAPRTAHGATLGLALAATLYAVLSMTGLAVVLSHMGWLGSFVQVAGGLFLIYLGLQSRLQPNASKPKSPTVLSDDTFERGLRLGLLINLSNPKAITFFVSLYAVAISSETGLGAKSAILFIGFGMEVLWYTIVVAILSTGPARAIYNRFGVWFERTLGTILVVLGIRMIMERQP